MNISQRLLKWLQEESGKRIAQERFRVGFAEACPELEHSGAFRTELLSALQTLEMEGRLVLPKGAGGWDTVGNPKLPSSITMVRASVSAPMPSSATVWVPDLAFATGVRRTDTLERLRRINEYLIHHRDRTCTEIPFRERALEIFDDEKAFEGQIKKGMLYGVLPISVLGMCDPEPPLPREDFEVPGAPLLLLENHHTYWSFLRWNRVARVYTSIAYGNGNTIMKSGRALVDALERSQAAHAEYFGDLDPTGLVIPATINEELRGLGQPEIRPATFLYQRLLAEGKRRPLGANKRQDPGTAIDWLPADLAIQAKQLFGDRTWMPQEGLRLQVAEPHSRIMAPGGTAHL
jgi:hypothetical protein